MVDPILLFLMYLSSVSEWTGAVCKFIRDQIATLLDDPSLGNANSGSIQVCNIEIIAVQEYLPLASVNCCFILGFDLSGKPKMYLKN